MVRGTACDLARVSGFGFRVSCFVFRVSCLGFGFRVLGFGFWFRVLGFGFRVRVLGFGFWVSDFGLGFRVSGFGFRVSAQHPALRLEQVSDRVLALCRQVQRRIIDVPTGRTIPVNVGRFLLCSSEHSLVSCEL